MTLTSWSNDSNDFKSLVKTRKSTPALYAGQLCTIQSTASIATIRFVDSACSYSARQMRRVPVVARLPWRPNRSTNDSFSSCESWDWRVIVVERSNRMRSWLRALTCLTVVRRCNCCALWAVQLNCRARTRQTNITRYAWKRPQIAVNAASMRVVRPYSQSRATIVWQPTENSYWTRTPR